MKIRLCKFASQPFKKEKIEDDLRKYLNLVNMKD